MLKSCWYNFKSLSLESKGFIIGIIIAIIVLVIGIFKTVFIAFCALMGYYIGKSITSNNENITNFLDRILPPGMYR